jgi:hypothetical protein
MDVQPVKDIKNDFRMVRMMEESKMRERET